jgi:hypothetical protein
MLGSVAFKCYVIVHEKDVYSAGKDTREVCHTLFISSFLSSHSNLLDLKFSRQRNVSEGVIESRRDCILDV